METTGGRGGIGADFFRLRGGEKCERKERNEKMGITLLPSPMKQTSLGEGKMGEDERQ